MDIETLKNKEDSIESSSSSSSYTTMVLSGGAVRGFALLGAVQYLLDQGWTLKIRRYIGTSIGAILAYLFCIGYTPIEIMVLLCQKGFMEKLANVDLMNLMHGQGIASFTIVQEMLEKMTVTKIKRYITLGELFEKYDRELVCCTYNQTLEKVEYISYKTHPTMDCLTALKMSASLPFLFNAFWYEDSKYIDGGISDNFPISQIEPEDVAIAIRMVNSSTKGRDEADANTLETIYRTLIIPIQELEDLRILHHHHANTDLVTIVIPHHMGHNLNMSNTEKFDMFSTGYEQTRHFFSEKI